jgi:hypothetical protein
MRRLGVWLAVLLILLCSCTGGSGIVEGTEITYRGTVTDRALSPVEEKPYSFMEETRAYIGFEDEAGALHCFWERKGGAAEEWPKVFPGDLAEITVATEAGSGLTVVVRITLLEKGDLHRHYETASWYGEDE